jgi:hypothetical protein
MNLGEPRCWTSRSLRRFGSILSGLFDSPVGVRDGWVDTRQRLNGVSGNTWGARAGSPTE